MLDFTGRRYLITGVLTEESIAWHAAAALQKAGAQILLTGFGRSARLTRLAAANLPDPPDVLELDVTKETDFTELATELECRWGHLDGALHCVASAPKDAIGGEFLATPVSSAMAAFHTSAYSLHTLAVALTPLLTRSATGGSVVGLSLDGSRALPGYDWMGVSKAALESISRYLSLYLGQAGVRVNLVAAGPVETVSAQGIRNFDAIADGYTRYAPLGWDRTTPERVVGPILFLLSELSATVTGEIVHADGGMHAVVAGISPLRTKAGHGREEAE